MYQKKVLRFHKLIEADEFHIFFQIVVTEQGFLWEEGPNSFQASSAMLRFLYDINLAADVVFADGEMPRFIYHKNKLHRLPSSLTEFATSDFFSGQLVSSLPLLLRYRDRIFVTC